MIVTQQKEKTPTIQDAPSKNTYHVVNKNIAPSNVTDGLKTKEGMPFRGIPKLRLFGVLDLGLGCLSHPQP